VFGPSSFHLRLVNLSISTTISKAGRIDDNNALAAADTTATILQMTSDDLAELGNSGKHNVVEGKVHLHYEAIM
jgi:hypothetical protein